MKQILLTVIAVIIAVTFLNATTEAHWTKLIAASDYPEYQYNYYWTSFALYDDVNNCVYNAFASSSDNIKKVWKYDLNTNQFTSYPISNYPSDFCSARTLDKVNNRIIMADDHDQRLYAVSTTGGELTQIANEFNGWSMFGLNAFQNPITNNPVLMNGYGWYAVRNGVYESNQTTGQWITRFSDRNAEPWKRASASLTANADGTEIYMFGGFGKQSGSQYGNPDPGFLPWASDIGYWDWLKDIWKLNLTTWQWTNIIGPNDPSIICEGGICYKPAQNKMYLIGTYAPSPVWGGNSNHSYIGGVYEYKVGVDAGFTALSETGEVPPPLTGVWGNTIEPIYDSANDRIICFREDGIWALDIVEATPPDIIAGEDYVINSNQNDFAVVVSTIDLYVDASTPIDNVMYDSLPPEARYDENYLLAVHGSGIGNLTFYASAYSYMYPNYYGAALINGQWQQVSADLNGTVLFSGIDFQQSPNVQFIFWHLDGMLERPVAISPSGPISPYLVRFSWDNMGGDNFYIHLAPGQYEYHVTGICHLDVSGLPHGTAFSWNVYSVFDEGTEYEWGIYSWPLSFTTNLYDIMPDETLNTGNVSITSTLGINVDPVDPSTIPVIVALPNFANLTESSVFRLSGSGTGNLTFQVGDGIWYGYIYFNNAWHWGSPHSLSGPGSFTFSNVDFGAKGEVLVLMGSVDPTLPVELSSFAATLTALNNVNLNWVSESETGMLGYRVYRNTSADYSVADLITPVMIEATNTSTQQSYNLTDNEVEINNTYYYWLESVDYNSTNLFGPSSVKVQGNSTPPVTNTTMLGNAFPNPFKTITTINVEVKSGETASITIYNLVGQTVRTYNVNEGSHTICWDGRDSRNNVCGSGIYFYKLASPSMNQTKKMVVIK